MVEEQVDVDYISLYGYIRNTLQTQKCMQNTRQERTGVPEQRKGVHRTTQNSVG